MKVKQFLVYCEYEYYCQGMEKTWGYFLVTAPDFETACDKVYVKTKHSARHFENMTID